VANATAVTSASVPIAGDVRMAGMISGCDMRRGRRGCNRQCP
jgi:hypothetical protein